MTHNYIGVRKEGVYRITKEFKFEAAHRLHNLSPGHKCARQHGHSYRVEVVAESDTLDSRGFIFDYAELDPLKQRIIEDIDHHDLNEIYTFQTSAENLARYIFDWARKMWPQVIGSSGRAITPSTSYENIGIAQGYS